MSNSSYPNFLGIGAVRGGSTWLYEVLKSHPRIYFPTKRKEIQFFTRYYDKGEQWYRGLFENAPKEAVHRGDFTPGYLMVPKGPERIHALGTVERFVLILRDPVERTYSHYKWHLRVTGEQMSFRDFYTKMPRLALENGLYFKHLTAYLKHFEPRQFLVLTLEESKQAPEVLLNRLADFFEVDGNLFRIPEATNQSQIPRYRRLFNLAHKFNNYLRRKDLDAIPNLFISLGMKKAFGQAKASVPAMTDGERQELKKFFQSDVCELEQYLGRSMMEWKNFSTETKTDQHP